MVDETEKPNEEPKDNTENNKAKEEKVKEEPNNKSKEEGEFEKFLNKIINGTWFSIPSLVAGGVIGYLIKSYFAEKERTAVEVVERKLQDILDTEWVKKKYNSVNKEGESEKTEKKEENNEQSRFRRNKDSFHKNSTSKRSDRLGNAFLD